MIIYLSIDRDTDTDVDIDTLDKLNSCSSYNSCPEVITDIYYIALLQSILEFPYPTYSTSISTSFFACP